MRQGRFQPPSGGCVLKPQTLQNRLQRNSQPPSGGCVLKPQKGDVVSWGAIPAAFRRLCVETEGKGAHVELDEPAAFRRLCVETATEGSVSVSADPAAFRRLCVETLATRISEVGAATSRLQAAVC